MTIEIPPECTEAIDAALYPVACAVANLEAMGALRRVGPLPAEDIREAVHKAIAARWRVHDRQMLLPLDG